MIRSTLLLFAALGASAPTLAQTAETIWNNNCLRCHGASGVGANASSLLDDEWEVGPTNRDLFKAVKEGVPDFGMPAYDEALTDEQIWATVNYIREFRERARREAEPAPHDTAGEDGVIRSDHQAYQIHTLLDGELDTPWSLAFLPDGALLVTERSGNLRIFHDGRLSAPISGTPRVLARGQGGLMDVAPHPDHAENGWIYLAFSDPSSRSRNESMTKIVRGRIDEGRWRDEETIFDSDEALDSPAAIHHGCRIVFDGRGHVFFGIGDRGRQDQAQDLSRPNGKVHRVRDDGSIPSENPFVDHPDALPTIWSYGHRNPQGLAWKAETSELWLTEHAPRGGDELNLVKPGRNYGWPLVSHGINYNGTPFETPWPDTSGVEQEIEMPVHVWLPSTAACGLDVSPGALFPRWQGDLFSGGLAGQIVERLRIEDGRVVEREEIIRDMGRVRDVVFADDGALYVVLNGPDMILRLVPPDNS